MNKPPSEPKAQLFRFKSQRLKYVLFVAGSLAVVCSVAIFQMLPQHTQLAYGMSTLVAAICVLLSMRSLGILCAQWSLDSGVFKMVYMNGLKSSVALPIHETQFTATSNTCKAIHRATGKLMGQVHRQHLRIGDWDDLLKLAKA
jgi:hypothetical protein